LAELSKQIAGRMTKYPELVDVNPILNLNTPELQVKLGPAARRGTSACA